MEKFFTISGIIWWGIAAIAFVFIISNHIVKKSTEPKSVSVDLTGIDLVTYDKNARKIHRRELHEMKRGRGA